MSRSSVVAVVTIVAIAAIAAIAVYLVRSDGEEIAGATSTTTTSEAAPDTSAPEEGAPPTSTAPGSTTSPQPSASYTPVFEEAECDFELLSDVEPRCGYVVVPEDRSAPDNGNSVRLHVAIFESTDPDAPDDPIIYLDGGPGGESLSPLQFSLDNTWADYLANRDVIFFDQRGVGASTPSLDCPEALEYDLSVIEQVIDPADYLDGEVAALTECRDRLASEGIDLTQYNSNTNAADVADIRIAVDIPEWNLLGISYGTRLAETVMRDHPEGVRSVILDSTYTPEVSLITESSGNFDRALDVLFAGCAADPACAAAFPDLEARVFALVDRLDEAPVTASVRDVANNDRYDMPVDGQTMLGTIFQGLYSNEVIPVLPQLVAELEEGTTTTVAILLTNQLFNANFLSYGMHLSVQCNEEVPFTDPDELDAALAEEPELQDFYAYATTVGPPVFSVCDMWDAGTADPIENEPIVSDLPTLVMAGEYDPITPPRWGEQAVTTLTNSSFVVFPGIGHGASVSDPCPTSVAVAFFDDPATTVDTACVEAMSPPAFAGASDVDEGPIELVEFSESIFGVDTSGVRPASWDSAGPGVWARQRNATDQTSIVQQAAPGEMEPATLLGLVSPQLGFQSDPVSVGEVEIDGVTWTLYEGDLDGFPTHIGIAPSDGFTGIVIMTADAAEVDDLYETVFLPAIEAFQAS